MNKTISLQAKDNISFLAKKMYMYLLTEMLT